MADPNTDSGSVVASVQASESDEGGNPVGAPGEIEPDADRCRTCDAMIGPQEFRLTRVVERGPKTLETHYCSEACWPEDVRDGADESATVRDWSYCR